MRAHALRGNADASARATFPRRWQEIKAYIEKQMAEAKASKEKRLNAKKRNA